MLFLCKFNIFFIFNSLLLVFTADFSTKKAIEKKYSSEMLTLVFYDQTLKMSRLYFRNKYFILVDDDFFTQENTEFDCLKISVSVLENYKKLKQIYEKNVQYREYNTRIIKFIMFKDIIFKNFVGFLKKFGEKNFINNKRCFLDCVRDYMKEKISEFKYKGRSPNQKKSDLHQKEINFYTSFIKNKNLKSISEFIYILIYFKKEVILKFKDVKCYIRRIKRENPLKLILFKDYKYEIHIYKIKNDQFSTGKHKHNYSELLALIEGFVEFHKNNSENFEFSFNIILNYKKDCDAEGAEGAEEAEGAEGAEVSEYGNEFISGVKKIVNENNKNENTDATRFLYRSQSIEKRYIIRSKAFQFELKESEVEGEHSTKFLVSFEDVI